GRDVGDAAGDAPRPGEGRHRGLMGPSPRPDLDPPRLGRHRWFLRGGCLPGGSGAPPAYSAERRGALPVRGCLALPIDPVPDAGTAVKTCFWTAGACGRARARTLLFSVVASGCRSPLCDSAELAKQHSGEPAAQPWEAFEGTS